MNTNIKKIIDSKCGLHCSTCEYKSTCGCGGCIATNGHPFYGECSVATCCQNEDVAYCGECDKFPCELLTKFSCDPEHGDTPPGARIEECKKWCAQAKKIENLIMTDVYTACPSYENESYLLRMVKANDTADLLKVYSDKKALPFFNSDNCGGEDFYYTTEKEMAKAIEYWLWEYSRKGFVRWAVVSKAADEAIGTIELFHRNADDCFTNCGLLRLDLRSDYENADEIENILKLIIAPAYILFDCDKIATKAVSSATERISALERLGFQHSNEPLIGHDGTQYGSYFVLNK